MFKFLHFILSHSIFIACCAVGLCLETNLVLQQSMNFYLYGFVFFSTICSYNFYWLISKFYFSESLNGFVKSNYTFIVVFIGGAIGTCYFFSHLNKHYSFIIISILLTLLYSLPLWPFSFTKKLQGLGFAKTILLSFTWAYVTCILPAVNNSLVLPNNLLLLLIIRFLFMLMLCIMFDMRDVKIDKMNGLHSLATDFGNLQLYKIFYISLGLYGLLSFIFFFYYGYLLQLIAPFIMGVICYIVFKKSLKSQGYTFYYFLVDGLMMLSSLLNFIVMNLFVK